jgi:predicted transcriptional regulator
MNTRKEKKYPGADVMVGVCQLKSGKCRMDVRVLHRDNVMLMSHKYNCTAEKLQETLKEISKEPNQFYSYLNSLPNKFKGMGFSEIVTGLEHHLDSNLVAEALQKYPLLMTRI